MAKLQPKPVYFYLLFACLYVWFVFWQPDSGFDKYFWIDWANDIANHGLGAIYHNPEVNYHPFILYLLEVFTWFQPDINKDTISGFKSIVILFDLATLGLVVWLLDKFGKSLWWVLVLLLNPAFWYNTIVWGQTDGIYTFFVFAAIVAAMNQHISLGAIFFLLALNTKMQAIIFLPLFIVWAIHQKEKIDWLRVGVIVGALEVVIFLPFIISGNLFVSLRAITYASIDQYPVLSRNAHNLWYMLFDDPFNTPDDHFKYLGMAFFVGLYALAIWQFILKLKKSFNEGGKLWLVCLVAALVVLIFFFFNTQMHERYVHSAVLFLGLWTILSEKLSLYVLVSLAYLINLESVMQFGKYFLKDVSENYGMDPILASILFLLAVISSFTLLFRFNTNSK